MDIKKLSAIYCDEGADWATESLRVLKQEDLFFIRSDLSILLDIAEKAIPVVEIDNEEDKCNWECRKEAAEKALKESNNPIMMMDEYTDNDAASHFAMGWNSVFASDENKSRFEAKNTASNK